MENLYIKALEILREEMSDYIFDNWDEKGMGEKGMSSDEAEIFLGYDTSDMSQEEIDDAVSEIQSEYYYSSMCSLDELVDKFVEMHEV